MSENKLFAWQDTKGGLVFIVLFNLLITYTFASLAIDTGSLLDYFITIAFLALTISQAVKLFRKLIRRG
jgi:hypothetical protein